MGEIIGLDAHRNTSLTCECGSVWFNAIVEFDKNGRPVSWARDVECRECGATRSLAMGGAL